MGSLYGRGKYGRGLYSRILGFIKLVYAEVRTRLRILTARASGDVDSVRAQQELISIRATSGGTTTSPTTGAKSVKVTGKTPKDMV